eukprot:CAMPEP_0171456558 /NCGR_PEP_ID=MMETSP0945-20130129/2993_1 /TAXON_ID=109269 /ORGANISM="Vaucheria litorea, Strain CCMP2940" /LENGTH=87 /DNA_ID=CAMNT_0011981999 /DNA_START=39 /DNA_END=302 /DNA_ORIENTATION=-
MTENIRKSLGEVDFPFAVAHDPDDGVVMFEGTEILLREASTPSNVKRGRDIFRMKGMKHDLLTNASLEVIESTCSWFFDRLEDCERN